MRAWSAVFLAALALRAGFALFAPGVPTADGESYQRLAERWVVGHGYVYLDGSPAVTWLPGWPALLTALYAVFGNEPRAAMLANALFGAATALLVGLLGARWFGPRVGALAGAIYAVWPGLVYYTATLYTESLFNLLLVGTLWLLATGRAAWAGLGLGLCAWVKAEPLVLAPLILAFLWTARRDRADFARGAALVLGIAALVIAPWVVRNQLLLGRAILSANGGTVAWLGNHDGSIGTNDIFAARRFARKHARETQAETQLARHDAGWAEARRFVRERPAQALVIVGYKLYFTYVSDAEGATIVRGWAPRRRDRHLSELTWLRMVRLADRFWYAVLALAAVGATTVRRWPREAAVVLFGLPLTWLAVHVVFIGGPRFHVPETPAYALLASLGVLRLVSLGRRAVARKATS